MKDPLTLVTATAAKANTTRAAFVEAVVAAHKAGNSYRKIAAAAGMTPEGVRGMVATATQAAVLAK